MEDTTDSSAEVIYEPPTDVLVHKAGCPASRIESFTVERPPVEDEAAHSGEEVTVERCIECGNQVVTEAAA